MFAGNQVKNVGDEDDSDNLNTKKGRKSAEYNRKYKNI